MNWDPISSAQAKNRDEAGVSPRRGRILKGEKPGELPVQQSTKVEMFLKPQDRQGARPYYPAPAARPCRRGDRIAGLLLRRVSPLLAQSGLSARSPYLSAFGAKRTWRDRRWRIDRSLMTQSRHRPDLNSAVQQSPAVP